MPLLVASIAGGLLLVTLTVAWLPVGSRGSAQPGLEPIAPSAPPPRNPPILPNVTFLPAGADFLLAPGASEDVLVHLPMPADLSGAFGADAPVRLALLTTGGFLTYETNGSWGTPIWASGPAPAAALSVAIPSGTWYLVLANPDPLHGAEVDLTAALEATFPPG